MLTLRLDRRLSARVDVSDILQEVYLDVCGQINGYLENPAVEIYVWLRGITLERLFKVHRFHLGAKRRSVAREVSLLQESSDNLADQVLAAGSSPSHSLRRQELRERVQQAVNRLRPDDREVILMRDFEGMSNGEVAQALHLSDSAATMRYGRALFRLKEFLIAELAEGESRI